MRFNNLNDWLVWQESLNPAEIDLGLERVAGVLQQAGLSTSFNCPLITVAGTNGKGSVVAVLEAIAISAGLKVCSYTSPHLFKYNERIKINGQAVTDGLLCEAFERIDQARCLPQGESQLTYFEFGTLAAIDIFFRQQPELVILEVGLGGRLDAVNIMEPDVSVLTSVAVDHIDWLGDDRESIGYEKAGIFRPGKPVICGDQAPPGSATRQAEKLQCKFIQAGRDFKVNIDPASGHWSLQSPFNNLDNLEPPSLAGNFQYLNAATAIVAMQVLQAKDPAVASFLQGVSSGEVISAALSRINLPGRFQLIHSKPSVYVDVAHNPQAAGALASQLKSGRRDGVKTWAIVAMLGDKDVAGVVDSVSAEIDCWCFAGLENISRGLPVNALLEKLPGHFLGDDTVSATNQEKLCKITQQNAQLNTVLQAKTVKKACEIMLSKVNENDRIIIFGSFYTVAEAMQYFVEINHAEN